jgi:uncharacterized protein YuzE
MAEAVLKKKDVKRVLAMVPAILHGPVRHYWVDYDEEADVLYISFRKPQRATDSELRDNGIIVRTAGSELVGLTVLDASKRVG